MFNIQPMSHFSTQCRSNTATNKLLPQKRRPRALFFSMHSSSLFYLCALALLVLPSMGRSLASESGSIDMPTSPVNGTQARDGVSECGGRGCKYFAKRTVGGNGYKSFKASTLTACCNKCFTDTNCVAWSWGIAGKYKRYCYFFTKAQYLLTDNVQSTPYFNTGFGSCLGQ